MYACIIKTHLLLAYSTKTVEWTQQLSSWLTAKGNGDLGEVSLSKLKQSVENATVLNGLCMFYAFYETPMLRTVHVMCYIFILHQWKKSTYLISRFDVSVMLKCYIDLFGQQVCDNLFFYQHKNDHLPFWICFDVCNLIFIWIENFSYTISLTCCSLIPIRSTIPFIVYLI